LEAAKRLALPLLTFDGNMAKNWEGNRNCRFRRLKTQVFDSIDFSQMLMK
jgi:hypothetical protein